MHLRLVSTRRGKTHDIKMTIKIEDVHINILLKRGGIAHKETTGGRPRLREEVGKGEKSPVKSLNSCSTGWRRNKVSHLRIELFENFLAVLGHTTIN